MSKKNGKDYLYLIWKHPETRRQYIVGILSKNKLFEFKYDGEFKEAKASGFSGLIAFKNFEETYVSEKLFPVFASRLPDRKRKDIKKILEKYKIEEYDEYLLLKNSGARLPIDTFEFIDPIFSDEKEVEREFFIAGIRYYIKKCDNQCNFENIQIDVGDDLVLKLEPKNKFDKYAVEIYNKDNVKLGYIPRYYSEQVTLNIKNDKNVVCTVIEFSPNSNCWECIKVKLKIY